jgi:hypothetical protein
MRAWLVASAVLVLAFAPAPLPKRAKGKDHESQLMGAWRIKTIRWQGRDSYDASSFAGFIVNKKDRVVISRGRITFQADGQPGTGDRAIALQLSGAGEVRHVDFGERARPMMGLYKLSGGILYLSFNYNYGPRPTQLTGDGDEIAFVLDRR